jgi:hypothetical protein
VHTHTILHLYRECGNQKYCADCDEIVHEEEPLNSHKRTSLAKKVSTEIMKSKQNPAAQAHLEKFRLEKQEVHLLFLLYCIYPLLKKIVEAQAAQCTT